MYAFEVGYFQVSQIQVPPAVLPPQTAVLTTLGEPNIALTSVADIPIRNLSILVSLKDAGVKAQPTTNITASNERYFL